MAASDAPLRHAVGAVEAELRELQQRRFLLVHDDTGAVRATAGNTACVGAERERLAAVERHAIQRLAARMVGRQHERAAVRVPREAAHA